MTLNTTSSATSCQCPFLVVTKDTTTDRSDSKRACVLSKRIDVNKLHNAVGGKQLLLHARIYGQHKNANC